MNLVEQHRYKFNNEMDSITFQTKNLYNSCLYIIRQDFIQTGKYIGFKSLYQKIKQEKIWNDCNLPKKLTNQIIKLVDQNFSSFFSALKSFKKSPDKFKGRPKIPQYKDPIKGRTLAIYEKGSLSIKEFKQTGRIKLSQTNIIIPTKIKDWNSIKQVRIVPNNNYFNVEVIYSIKEKEQRNTGNYASIDMGLNNLMTVGFNNGKNPFIINGRPLKAINQFYNKKRGVIQSKLEKINKKKTSNTLNKLTEKRNNKIKDYLHKASRYLINQLVSREISTIIIGRNKLWKQDINIGKRNNQNFVDIPYHILINMLTYKAKLEGITVIEQEEAYTSKCSFLDQEPIKKHEKYKGSRIQRGLFKSNRGIIINADLNAAYNILQKAVFKNNLKLLEKIEGFAVSPKLISI